MSEPLLEIADVVTAYGKIEALRGVTLAVAQGSITCLLGPNGAGKTTLMLTTSGILRARRGSIRLFGNETIGWPPERIARLGLGYVPEERGIYASLDVTENLVLPPILRDGGMSLAEIYRLFPNLLERRRSAVCGPRPRRRTRRTGTFSTSRS